MESNSLPQGNPPLPWPQYSTDAEYGYFVKTLHDLADTACKAYLAANAGHPSVSKLKELNAEIGQIQTWLNIAKARHALMLSGLEIDEERQARQPLLFADDPSMRTGPYGAKGGRS